MKHEEQLTGRRLVAASPQDDELQPSVEIRPRWLDEYIGQEQVKQSLRIFIQAARQRGEPLDHVLFHGFPGLGKTTLAYIIAASACVLLIACYVASVLHSWLRASMLSALLLMLYGVLYFLLHTREWTLILGSSLVFAALAVIMLLTRKLDWYALEQRHRYRTHADTNTTDA